MLRKIILKPDRNAVYIMLPRAMIGKATHVDATKLDRETLRLKLVKEDGPGDQTPYT